MYAPSRVSQRIDEAQREFNLTLERHSISDVESFESHLKRHNMYALDVNGRPTGTQLLTQFEHDWILNEQLLVACDASYALTRYCYLKDDDGVIHRFDFRVPQRIFYDIIADLEASGRTLEFIILKARQLGMCLDPDTRVLTSNLEWKRIRDVVVGEELVSVDENPAGGKGNHRRMRKAVVEARNEVIEPVIRICTEDGRGLYATKQHRFLCKVRGNSATEWRMSEDLRIGDEIRWVTDRWDEPDYEDGWFGGLLDGEGSLRPKSRAGSELCVSQIPGPVLDRAKKYLDSRGYHYREEIDDRVGGSSSKFGNKPVHKLVIGRMDEIFRIIGQTRPSRLLAKEWWEGKELPGKKAGTGWSKVKSVENLLERRSMIDLQTSTKTFIAEGFVSHNSTLVELLISLRIVFGHGVNAVIGSADQTKTAEMSKMIFLMYDYLPIWLRPQYTRRVESDRGLLAFGKSSTSVSFQHGAQMSGIARGTTPTIYHLSEVATFTDPVNQIESALFRAVHASPNVFGALESSGEGDKGWWPERWRSSRDYWHKHAARHCPLFLPWFCGVEMYPKHQWIRYDFPIPPNWYPNQDTREHVAKCELYIESNPHLKKHLLEDQRRRGSYLGPRWRMPVEQQWFWEFGHEEAKRTDATAKWYQEMCADDEEALQKSITSAFSHQTLAEIETRREKTFDMYCIVGQSIEADHEPPADYIDYGSERIPVKYTNMREESYRWELVPLLEKQIQPNPKDPNTATGIIFIWAHPQPGVRYSIGVDTAAGRGEDSTAISVWALGKHEDDPDTQVAELASSYINHAEAFAFVLGLAAYYGTHMKQEFTGKWKEPYVSIEVLASVGDMCQKDMASMGYSHFHMMSRYDGKNPRRDKAIARKRGFFTGTWSREALTSYFAVCAKNLWLHVNSPWLLEEMRTFEAKVTSTGRQKLEHEDGKHDDRVFAAAMACFCPHDLEPIAGRSKKRSVNPAVLPPLNLQPSRPTNIFSPKDMQQREIATVTDLAYELDQMERYR